MGPKRNRKSNKKLKNGKMKMSNSNTNKQNEKPERTDDSGTPSQDDREDSTQRLGLDEAEKNKSDHDMSPNEKEGKERTGDSGTLSQDDREDSTQRLSLEEAEKNKSDHDMSPNEKEGKERTDDSGTPSQDDREDSTQRLSLEEAEKNKSDHDMSPNEKEGKERTDDSGTPSQDDREDSTQRLSLEEAEKNKSDHDMSPNEKEGKEMESLEENDGNDNDDHGGKKLPKLEVCENAMFQDDNTDGRKNYPRNNVNDGTESNNDQSTSEEGKSRKAEITTKSDSANKIETTVTSNAKSDDPSQQSFQTSETNHDGIDTEEQHCDNNTIKIEEGKQADRNRVDEIESQTEHEHMNMDANQQKGEDGERTNDIAMTRSNNDQTTPEEDQPKHMERTTESIGKNGEKTVVGVSPSQSFQTGDIKDDQMDGTEERHQPGHVDGTEERHQHVDGTEEQHQHRHVNSDVEQQNGQVDNDSTKTEADNNEHETMSHVNGEKTAVDDGPSQSFQTGDIKHDEMDGAEVQQQYGHVEGAEEQAQHGPVDMGVDQQIRQVDNDSTNTEADNNEHETMSRVNGEKTAVDDGPSQSFQTGDIKHDQMDGAEVGHQHGHVDGTEERHQHGQVDGTEEQCQHVDGTEKWHEHGHVDIDVDQQNGQVDNDSTSTKADDKEDGPMSPQSSEYRTDRGTDETPSINASLNPRNKSREVLEEDTSTESSDVVRKTTVVPRVANLGDDNTSQSPSSGTNMAHYQRSDETHNTLSDIQNDSPSQSVQNKNIEHGNINSEEMQRSASPTTIDSPNTSITMTPVQGQDDSPSQSDQNENIEHGNFNSEEMQLSASPTTIDSSNTYITMTPVQGQPSGAFGDDVGDPGLQDGEMSLDENEAENNNVVGADNFEKEMDSFQSPSSGTNMAHYQGSDETHNAYFDIQNDSPSESVQNKNIEHGNINSEEMQRSASPTTIDSPNTSITMTPVQGQDDSPSQGDQNENIEHGDINSEEMQLSASPTTIDSSNTYITMTPVQGQPSGAFGDDVSDPGLQDGRMSLDENEAENNNVVGADNFEKEMDSFQSPSSGTNMAHYQGSDETHNAYFDIQNDSPSESVQNKNIEHGNINSEEMQRSASPTTIDSPNTSITMTPVQGEDDSPSQGDQNENIEHGDINSEEMQLSASPTTIDSSNTYITMTPVQGQPSGVFGDDVGDPGLQDGRMSLDENEAENNNVVGADNFEKEMDSFQSPSSGTNMAHYQGSDETHNTLSDIQNDSPSQSVQNKNIEHGNINSEEMQRSASPTTIDSPNTSITMTPVQGQDDSPSQSVQNENIEHGNMNSEEMQLSASPTTIDSSNTYITMTPVQEQPSGAFGDDVGDPGLQDGEISLYENEAENDNAVDADNFENEMDSPQSSESGNDMVHYEGSNETVSYNLLSDIQLKTSQEKEIEKLQRELNIKNENLATLQEEMKRRDELINEKNSENADILHRCVALKTSAEAADDLREQCEDKNHQIETLEGDLASVRNENESLKRHLEETENVAADHQRQIDDNKSLNEYLEQERQSSAALKEEARALKEQITNKEDVLKELESQIKKAIEEKEELGAKLASRNENNSDLLSNYLEMKKKEEELAAELKKMQENYQYEKRRLEEVSGQLSLRNKEVITTENKYKQEIEELKAKYKTEKDQAEKEKELLKQCVTKLNEGSQQLQAENKRIKDDLQLKSMECGNLKSERLRITGELNAAKKEIAELSNDKDKLGAYITTVNDEVRQLRAALELKEAEKNAANECMQKVVREKQEMMYSMGNLQRIELENHQLKHQNMDQSEQITKLHASLQEYGLLRDHIQEYYKALQDSQMELQREKEKSRHINELLSKTGYRLDSMASELNNYRRTTEGYRRSLEEEKEKSNKLERKLDRLTIDNEKLTEERDKCEQKSFEYKDECRSLREDLEKSQAECRDLLSQTQEGASDGTTSLLQGNYFTSTPMGNGFGKPSSQSNFVFGTGGDKMNRKK